MYGNEMKTIETEGITYIVEVPGATRDWYYGIDSEHGDLYEAEEMFKKGYSIKGRNLCIVHYPEGSVYFPVPKTEGCYSENPVFFEGGIYILNVNFLKELIQIVRFDCEEHRTSIYVELPLSSAKDCYNLSLQVFPLTLTRQCAGNNDFEIIWPERVAFGTDDHDSFFLRAGNRLFFNRWHEEGEAENYKYWEETIVRNLEGNIVETLPGDVILMPNGEIWNLK